MSRRKNSTDSTGHGAALKDDSLQDLLIWWGVCLVCQSMPAHSPSKGRSRAKVFGRKNKKEKKEEESTESTGQGARLKDDSFQSLLTWGM